MALLITGFTPEEGRGPRGGEGKRNGEGAPHPRLLFRRHRSAVSHVAPAVRGGVAVQRLNVPAGERDADAVRFPGHGGQVEDAHHAVLRVLPAAQQGDDGVVHVPEIDPLEPLGAEIHLVERRGLPVDAVQVPDELLHPPVAVPLQQVPLQRLIVVPFVPLSDLPAHEQELLPGMGIHVGIEQAKVGELPPQVAGHLVEHRALQVHDLVVGEGEDEVLVERIQEREGELAEMELPVDGVLRDERQHVVHPSHVPFQREPQPAEVHGAGDGGPCRGFLGDHDRAGVPGVDLLVQPLDEGDRVEVLPASEDVGDPLPGLARVVEVEHGRDRVDPQPVDVVLLQPEQGVGEQVVRHFPPPEVEDEGAPVAVLPLPRVRVLVEVGPVEGGEAVRVAGEVGRHPVEDHADPLPVAPVDEFHELPGASEPGRGGEIPEHLVSPRPVERVLRHRHQLDVGVPHLPHVRHEIVRQLPVGEVRTVRALLPLPGAEVDLIYGEGAVEDAAAGPVRHPGAVPPLVTVDGADDRSRAGRLFATEGEGIGLEEELSALPGADLVLVDLLLADPGEEDLPEARFAPVAHRVHPPVPVVRVAYHRHPLRVGRPHGEGGSGDAAVGDHVAAQLLVLFEVAPLGQQVDVVIGQDQAEGVRVVLFPPVPAAVGELEAVGEDLRVPGELRLEHAAGMDAGQDGPVFGLAAFAQQRDALRPGMDHPDGNERPALPRDDVGAQHRKRVPVARVRQEVDVALAEGGFHICASGKRHRTRNVISSTSFPPPRVSTEATTR